MAIIQRYSATYLDSDNPNTKYNGAAELVFGWTQITPYNIHRNVILEFDVSSIPDTATAAGNPQTMIPTDGGGKTDAGQQPLAAQNNQHQWDEDHAECPENELRLL